MKAILRIFKYARRRIIALSLENQMLRVQLEYYRAIVESDFKIVPSISKKHKPYENLSIAVVLFIVAIIIINISITH